MSSTASGLGSIVASQVNVPPEACSPGDPAEPFSPSPPGLPPPPGALVPVPLDPRVPLVAYGAVIPCAPYAPRTPKLASVIPLSVTVPAIRRNRALVAG